MGKQVSVKNPSGRTITFDEDKHEYTDDKKISYKSVTQIVSGLFPEFDSEKVSYFVARKRLMEKLKVKNKDAIPEKDIVIEKQIVLDEWRENADKACRLGTEVHRYGECNLLEIPYDMGFSGEKQKKMANSIDVFLPILLETYEFVEAEKIIFSPANHIAGTIDLIMRHRQTKKLCIFDWKTNKVMDFVDAYEKYGKLFLNHIPDCNYYHYVIQLNIYRMILLLEDYGDFEDIELGLFHVNTKTVRAYQISLMEDEAEQAIKYCRKMKS